MAKINVQQREIENGWEFDVEVVENDQQTNHKVMLTHSYYLKISKGKVTPAELVKKSFEFLLNREPVSAILPQFNLDIISQYFPEYQKAIAKSF